MSMIESLEGRVCFATTEEALVGFAVVTIVREANVRNEGDLRSARGTGEQALANGVLVAVAQLPDGGVLTVRYNETADQLFVGVPSDPP